MQQVKDLKRLHDYHATVVHLLTTRVQFYHEEFQGVQELVNFYKSMTEEIKTKIEALEKEQKDVKSEEPDSTTGAPV